MIEDGFTRFANPVSVSLVKQAVSLKPKLEPVSDSTNGSRFKIYHVVNSSTAIENLRSDLHNLVAWSNEWQMLFNVKKCKVMHLDKGYNNPKADYVMDGSVLQSVSEDNDLGVIVSDDFKWEKQCCEAMKKLIEY